PRARFERELGVGAVAGHGEVAAEAAGRGGESLVHGAVGLRQFAKADRAADGIDRGAPGSDGTIDDDGTRSLGESRRGQRSDGSGGGEKQGGLVHLGSPLDPEDWVALDDPELAAPAADPYLAAGEKAANQRRDCA